MRVLGLLLAAPSLFAQLSDDVFLRARRKILAAVDSLPNYTCVQTLNREYFRRSVAWPTCGGDRPGQGGIPSAKAQVGDRSVILAPPPDSAGTGLPSNLALYETDRFRLDVRVGSDAREIYSWAGAPQFDAAGLQEIVGTGLVTSGSFGPFLINIFGRKEVEFKYDGDEIVDGRNLRKLTYRVPRAVSRYDYRSAGNSRFVPFDGAFWVDPASANLVRLEIHTSAMPHQTGTCEATTTVDFHRIAVAGQDYLLPRGSTVEVSALRGHYLNTSEYSACRAYAAESSVRFDGGQAGITSTATRSPRKALPRGVRLTLALDQSLDSKSAAGGDMIRARVVKDAADRKTKAVIVPDGAVAEGRILRFAHQLESPAQLLITIEWQTLSWDGVAVPFSAVVDSAESSFTVSAAELMLGMPPRRKNLSGGRTLVIPAGDVSHVVPAGSTSAWVTR